MEQTGGGQAKLLLVLKELFNNPKVAQVMADMNHEREGVRRAFAARRATMR